MTWFRLAPSRIWLTTWRLLWVASETRATWARTSGDLLLPSATLSHVLSWPWLTEWLNLWVRRPARSGTGSKPGTGHCLHSIECCGSSIGNARAPCGGTDSSLAGRYGSPVQPIHALERQVKERDSADAVASGRDGFRRRSRVGAWTNPRRGGVLPAQVSERRFNFGLSSASSSSSISPGRIGSSLALRLSVGRSGSSWGALRPGVQLGQPGLHVRRIRCS